MMSPEERILHLSLRELLGDRRPPDLSDRIMAAVRSIPARRWARWPHLITTAAAAAVLLITSLTLLLVEPVKHTSGRLSTADQQRVTDWIALQRTLVEIDPTDPGDLARVKEAWQARRNLVDLLNRKPRGWAFARDQMLPLPEGFETLNVQTALLELLARAPDAARDPVVLERLETTELAFDEMTLIVLAEQGSETALAALDRRMAGGAPSSPFSAVMAAWFALRGDARGEGGCRRFLARSRSRDDFPEIALACAAGLRRLGDTEAWTDTVDDARTLAERHLEAGDIVQARRVVVAIEFVKAAVKSGAQLPLADIHRVVENRALRQKFRLLTPDAIRARLSVLDS